jgi:pimeloyl-ACP methyl ester carboxylesterase
MADNVAALLQHLGIEKVDLFGYSMEGGVVLQVAIRHPEVVRKLVAASVYHDNDGTYPEILETIEHITPEVSDGTPWREEYDRVAPKPEDFPTLVTKHEYRGKMSSQPVDTRLPVMAKSLVASAIYPAWIWAKNPSESTSSPRLIPAISASGTPGAVGNSCEAHGIASAGPKLSSETTWTRSSDTPHRRRLENLDLDRESGNGQNRDTQALCNLREGGN